MAFCGFLRQSTAVDVLIGPFVDDADADTPQTGLTLDVELSKNGQALANKNDATTPTHDSAGDVDGYYNCELDATDTSTCGILTLVVHHADALPVRLDFHVVEEAIYDALLGASAAGFDSNQRVDVGEWLGTAVTLSSTTSKPEVDAYSVSDDAAAANNLEADYDGTGYAKTNSTIGTCTTNTDMRGTDNAALASVCTAGRLGELDAANLPADVDTLTSRLSAARAGYLDNLNGHTPQTGDSYGIVSHGSYGNAQLVRSSTPANTLDVDVNGRVDVGNWLGTAVTVSATSSKPEVDAYSVSDDAAAANNLEADYDGTGYAKTNSTIGTCTTNTDMRGTDNAALASVCTAARLGELDAANLPADIDDILADTNELQTDDVPGLIAALNDVSTAEVKAQVVAAIDTDTYAEPGQEAPGAMISLVDKVGFLYKAWRNKSTQTSTLYALYNDDGSTVGQDAAVSDAGGTFTRDEMTSGA